MSKQILKEYLSRYMDHKEGQYVYGRTHYYDEADFGRNAYTIYKVMEKTIYNPRDNLDSFECSGLEVVDTLGRVRFKSIGKITNNVVTVGMMDTFNIDSLHNFEIEEIVSELLGRQNVD